MQRLRLWWRELLESGFRLVPAVRVENMRFVVDGTTASAKVATARFVRMGKLLALCGQDLERHPGSGDKRMAQTNKLRRLIRMELGNNLKESE